MTEILINIIYAVAGVAGLYWGAEFLVRGGSDLAKRAGVSALTIGLTLVAFATSAPELVVSISAALSGSSDISLGNVVGSNMCNIALILGLSAAIAPLTVQKQLLKFDAPVMVGATALLTVFYFISNGITRWQGAIFFIGIVAYVITSVKISKANNAGNDQEEEEKKLLSIPVALLVSGIGISLLVICAKIFLISAVFFAKKAGFSDAVIGLTIVAVGTSLPELATSVVAALKGEQDIAIGNVLGSNIFNILAILGITPLIKPLTNAALKPLDLGIMMFCTLILIPMMRTKWRVSRIEGILLLLIYFSYTTYLIIK